MKNYYEILEVDKNASSEIIDKAYKTLAKRYHPDMHEDDKKEWAEEHFKQINEAYEILSDEQKKAGYDAELASSIIDYSEKYAELCKQQEILKQELEILRQKYRSSNINASPSSNWNTNYSNDSNQIFYKKNYNQYPNEDEIRNQEFDRAYRTILHNLGYTLKQKRTFKDFLALLLTIVIIIAIIFLLWNIPFTKNYLISFYEENSIVKAIVDIFIK